MKTLVLGDIHGRTCWWDIIQAENPDKIIFLGDYVSTHDPEVCADQQCANLEDILNFKEGFGDNCILLRGNHDMQHLGYSWAECSGLDRNVQRWMTGIRDRFLKLTQWVHVDGDIVYSHAGVSEVWMKNVGLDNVLDINKLEPSEKFGFWPCKLSDYSGDSATQPPTWIRPWTLLMNSFGKYTYIVGHTFTSYHSPRVYNVKDETIKGYKASYLYDDNDKDCQRTIEEYKRVNEVWVADALPREYIIVEDGEVVPVKSIV